MRRASRAAFVTVVLATLACAGETPIDRSVPASSNSEACERYVDHINGLDCINVVFEVAGHCAVAKETSVDMIGHYACLEEHIVCEAGKPTLGYESCKPPSPM